ncbi:Fanconi anemia group D2 protein [Parasteatoda tepidariorum]|uniref:Fanconi anemia group D2 protein n=1 Tax=Parasteatoda tepidariorum TaxID=114398 RepID=UPI00077FA917|nr:Fanconi anemia group D2 protein [Parasteatoda tepidariorum]
MSSDEWIGKKISDVYLSQEPALVPKQTKRKTENYFEEVLQRAGYVTGEKNNANELNVDQAVFLRDLAKLLSGKANNEINKFFNGLESHLEDEIRFKWSLMPTVTAASCETARNASQDSLIHLLLSVEKIQEKVINIMLDKLVEFSYTENTALYDRTENKTVACLIISQFRWLNKLVNSEALADKLLELIEGTPTDIQRDIIRLLPDVINEFDHPKVAKSLGEFLLGNQELNVIILDTLTNLNIKSELLSEIRQKVIETISTANIEDLPVIVKFVLQDLTIAEAPQVIRELQSKLDFNSTFNPIISSTPINPKNGEISKSIESCVLTTIKHSLKFQKTLCDAWVKYLELLEGPNNHKALDIFVILIFLSLEINERKLESLLKNKVKAGDINEDLLQATFRGHHDVLQEYAKELLKIAELLLRAFEPVISSFACCVYMNCFVWFDSFYKQEVIGNLITHVGNKSESEVNSALNTLLTLIRNHTQKMVPYGLFIKNLLDHLGELTLNQIRKVHEMLSILAYQGGREGAMLLDDLLIIIRKQLSNKNVKYRKMGVIGALMSAKIAAEKENEEQEPDVSINSDALEFEECFQHSVKLLELVAASTSESNEAYALFCDELSHIMIEKKFGKSILEWIGENVLSDFEETFIIDIDPSEYEGKNIGPKFGLDEVKEPVAVDLYNIVKKETVGSESKSSKFKLNSSSNCSKDKGNFNQSKVLKTLLKISSVESTSSGSANTAVASPLKLAPMFRLLRMFREVQDGNLEQIDALLGCSIMLPDLRIQKFSVLSTAEKHLLLNTLFYCINWVRENINAFATTTDVDIRCNVLTRLQLLIGMENLVCKYLAECNGYSPPVANFDFEETHLTLKLPNKKGVKRSGKGKKGKNKKSKKDESTDQTTLENQDTSLKSKSSDSESEEEIKSNLDLELKISKSLQPFFRELDIDVFTLLQSDITFQKRPDVFLNEKVTSTDLHPDELKFLLEDLSSKLHHCFDSSTSPLKGFHSKQAGFSNLESFTVISVMSFCIDLIPSLCNTVEEILKYFKTLAVNSDGVEDSLLFYNNESHRNIECLHLILKVLTQIMSCKVLNLKTNSSLLKKALASFTPERNVPDHFSYDDLIRASTSHLCLFAESIPSLSCASSLTHLLSCILYFGSDSEPKEKVSKLSLKFLKKKWFEIESKSVKPSEINSNVKIILESYLRNSKSALKALEYLSVDAIPQLLKDDVKDNLFYTLNKSSLNCYYKIMFTSLMSYVKSYFSEKHGNDEQMNEWIIILRVFQVLTNLLKCFGSRTNIGTCLKFSREILQTFLRYGMPLMDKLFVNKKEEVICLMKTLQASTRYLQHVCCHSKVLKDVSLIKQVPFLKKSLEVFVFRVKVMLAVNKCEEAFWLGNLKNRDLKGEEILSQAMQDSNNDSDLEDNDQANKSDSDVTNVESEEDTL